MNQYGLESPRAQELISAATAMGPALKKRRGLGKAEGRVPDETVAEFAQAGFFKILQPEQWGGYAMDPQVFYAVGLEVARYCPSVPGFSESLRYTTGSWRCSMTRRHRMYGQMIQRY